jgi:hypothetical protein
MTKINYNGVSRDMTAEEQAQYDKDKLAWNNKSAEIKLAEIKRIRLERLIETDYLANSDVTMPDNIKTWRQTLRDLPANHSDEAAYDLLLARDDSGNLTHNVWSKP